MAVIRGGGVAQERTKGLVAIPKKGKPPGTTTAHASKPEYRATAMEVHEGASDAAENVLIVNDLTVTGGTCEAGIRRCERPGAEVVGRAFVIDLPARGGGRLPERLGIKVHVLCELGEG